MIKNIIGFREASGRPVERKQEVKEDLRVEPTYQKEEIKDDKFWDKKAYKQCLWNYWLEARIHDKNESIEIMTDIEMNQVWQVFNQIEQDADKRFSEVDGTQVPF